MRRVLPLSGVGGQGGAKREPAPQCAISKYLSPGAMPASVYKRARRVQSGGFYTFWRRFASGRACRRALLGPVLEGREKSGLIFWLCGGVQGFGLPGGPAERASLLAKKWRGRVCGGCRPACSAPVRGPGGGVAAARDSREFSAVGDVEQPSTFFFLRKNKVSGILLYLS